MDISSVGDSVGDSYHVTHGGVTHVNDSFLEHRKHHNHYYDSVARVAGYKMADREIRLLIIAIKNCSLKLQQGCPQGSFLAIISGNLPEIV